MKKNPPLIAILQIVPLVVFILALVNPYSAIPIFVILGLLFFLILFKFFQQTLDDFERELYIKEKKPKDFQAGSGFPFNLDEDLELNKFNRLQPYLYILRLSFPYTIEQLNQNYRKRARETHPDLPGGNKHEFIRVHEAYEVLKEALLDTPRHK